MSDPDTSWAMLLVAPTRSLDSWVLESLNCDANMTNFQMAVSLTSQGQECLLLRNGKAQFIKKSALKTLPWL